MIWILESNSLVARECKSFLLLPSYYRTSGTCLVDRDRDMFTLASPSVQAQNFSAVSWSKLVCNFSNPDEPDDLKSESELVSIAG